MINASPLRGGPTDQPTTRDVIAATVLRVEQHPAADRLVLVNVDTGSGTPVQIVMSGSLDEVNAGDSVPVVLPGGREPNGKKVRAETFRGERSGGRILSYSELGWDAADPSLAVVLETAVPAGAGLPL